MSRRLRLVLGSLVALALLLFALWRWLDASEPVPETTSYRIDVGELQRLAGSLPGPKPRAIRSVLVAEASLPRGVVFAGEPFVPQPMVHQVFQLVWDDRFALVDTAFPPELFEKMASNGRGEARYHEEGWDEVRRALGAADFVVVTHEHFDHLGGAAALPLERAEKLRLAARQLANEGALDDAGVPAALRGALEPLPELPAQALAPGVVLLAAPGHTPGSQIVYVELSGGRAALLLGDLVWNAEQIAGLHYRPRHVTFVLGENRAQVLDEIRALHTLRQAHPEIVQIVSHDPLQRASLLAEGLLTEGFERIP